MLRTPIASASKLAWLVLVSLGSTACAHGLGDAFLDDTGAGGAPGCDNTVHASSSSSSSSSGTWSSSSSSSGGGTCDSSGDCGTCGNCAFGSTCAPQMNACETDQDCTALLDCLSNCADQTCADNCAAQYPNGQSGYMAVVVCVLCDACAVSCAGQSQGACGP